MTGTSTADCTPFISVNNGTITTAGGQAHAGYGVLGVEANGTVDGTIVGATTASYDVASFQDPFTITSSAPFTGFLVISDTLYGFGTITGSGSFTTDPSNPAENAAYLLVGSSGNQRDTGPSPFVVTSTSAISATVDYNGRYVTGGTLVADLTTASFCQLTGPGDCNVDMDFYDTSIITGMSLVDANGIPLDATITFASGTDYNDIPNPDATTPPVPEPSTLAFVSSGLVGMVGFVRRQLLLKR
jgi:hypothetical protein